MKKGDSVTIYHDPMTQERPEGQAILVKRLDDVPEAYDELEYWRVRFLVDGPRVFYNRFIKP